MAETWSSSRQIIVITANSYGYNSDRVVSLEAANRTYIERGGLTDCYLPTFDSRYCMCFGENPAVGDLPVMYKSFYRAITDRLSISPSNDGVVHGICKGINSAGPLVLQYPKYYTAPTMPPNFDISFKIWSEYSLDPSSLMISIQDNHGVRSYSIRDITLTGITDHMYDIQLHPKIDAMVGETVQVRVSGSDILGRPLRLDW